MPSTLSLRAPARIIASTRHAIARSAPRPSRSAAPFSQYTQTPFVQTSNSRSERNYGSAASSNVAPSSFLPVPFVTEQLAGAHHTTDLFSRLLKERIVCVYGPVEDRMVGSHSASTVYRSAHANMLLVITETQTDGAPRLPLSRRLYCSSNRTPPPQSQCISTLLAGA